MGYTHYWTGNGPVNMKAYKRALTDCRKIINYAMLNIPLANGAGDPNTKPELRVGIRFNGVGSDSHETFSLDGAIVKDFDFCKTNQSKHSIARIDGRYIQISGGVEPVFKSHSPIW